jgi:hypothetical protein
MALYDIDISQHVLGSAHLYSTMQFILFCRLMSNAIVELLRFDR